VLDVDDAPRLAYFPGMAQDWRAKVDLVRRTLEVMTSGFDVMTMDRAAQHLEGTTLPGRRVTGAPAPGSGDGDAHPTTVGPAS